ncbi:MAG: hypothetical protein A2080_14250 [Ignavibacteria bacterium GWC2_36_12]|nr:MAG: hypothetical protein A2080_14250 [Ignavibacteria bacterium GWC2_36_12]
MIRKKYGGFILILFMLLSISVYGQSILDLIPYNGTPESFLVAQIRADTTATGGLLPDRVYRLQRTGLYLNTEIFNVDSGQTMRMISTDGTDIKPVIFQYPTGTGANPHRPPGNLFVLRGGNLELSNVIVAGYFEPVDTNLNNVQGGLINTTQPGCYITIDGCILTNINGQHVRTGSASQTVKITNTIFANMGALTSSNLGAGKGLDLREASCDSLILVNNTFVNYQDRPVRHYNFGNPLAGTGNINYCLIDHNSFINGMSFHGLLSLGNVGSQVFITNNLFVDGFALGEDENEPNGTRSAEWANTGETYDNGNNRQTWIFTAPNDTTQWTVKNNFYVVSDSGQAFIDDNSLRVGDPLSWHINGRLGADSVNAFTQLDLVLANIPMLMTNEMRWYRSPSGGNFTKNTPNSLIFNVETDDMDRRGYAYYADTLDASYPTSSPAYVGGEHSFPAGDLNWFPDKKAEWETYTPLDIVVDGEKDAFYETLTGPADGYLQVRSFSFSDNGAPADDADLSAKMWVGWDNDWFYFYEEVMDDTISANAANDYQVDCLELKFDPQATDSNNTGSSIYGINLTALDTSTAGVTVFNNLNGIPASMKQWARKTITGGYALELALKWPVITANSENISVGVDNVFGLGINNHDNDVSTRQASITWAAVLLDHIWDTPKYLGTAKFLAGNKLQFIPTNNMTGVTNSLPYDGSAAGVEQTSSLIPREFGLNQNYPNPFNPSTTIEFALPKQATVELAVYNLLGQRIAVLVNEDLQAGYYQTSFDAHSLPSGVYFYRIQAGSFVQTKKLMLLK